MFLLLVKYPSLLLRIVSIGLVRWAIMALIGCILGLVMKLPPMFPGPAWSLIASHTQWYQYGASILLNNPNPTHLLLTLLIGALLIVRAALALESRRLIISHLRGGVTYTFWQLVESPGARIYYACMLLVTTVWALYCALTVWRGSSWWYLSEQYSWGAMILLGAIYMAGYLCSVYTCELIVDHHDTLSDWIYYSAQILKKSLVYWIAVAGTIIGFYALGILMIMWVTPPPFGAFVLFMFIRSYMTAVYFATPFVVTRGYIAGSTHYARQEVRTHQQHIFTPSRASTLFMQDIEDD